MAHWCNCDDVDFFWERDDNKVTDSDDEFFETPADKQKEAAYEDTMNGKNKSENQNSNENEK